MLEIILVIIAFLGFIFKLLNIPSGFLLMLIGLLTLSVFYILATFQNNRFFKIFKEKVNLPSSLQFSGIALSLACIGILFKLNFWEGSANNLIFALSSCILFLLLTYAIKLKIDLKPLKIRLVVFSILTFILLFTSNDALIDLYYRDNKPLNSALKEAVNEPQNRVLWQKVDSIRQLEKR